VETFYPALLPHVSSSISTIGMQGPSVKVWFANRMNIDPRNIVNVALTPCTAKKFEIRRQEMCDAGKELGIDGIRDMDYVITTRELAKWLREEDIDFDNIAESNYDRLMGEASGAGVIFGNSGGVMEAAARTAYFMVTGNNPPDDFYRLEPVRGMAGIKSAKLNIGGTLLRLAVIQGTENAKTLIETMKKSAARGDSLYDFIEVMTCPGGCIGGGGQPKTEIPLTDEIRQARIDALYTQDESMTQRCSHDNPEIKEIYASFYGKPLSPLAERLLHTGYHSRAGDLKISQ
jgi:ferredoxin hydrogenase